MEEGSAIAARVLLEEGKEGAATTAKAEGVEGPLPASMLLHMAVPVDNIMPGMEDSPVKT